MNDSDMENESRESDGGADEHIVHCPETCEFEIGGDYDYLRSGLLETAGYFALRMAAHFILNIYNRCVFGLRVRGTENLWKTFGRGGAVVVSNHVHMLDCTFIDCILPHKRVYYSTLETNFRIPYARRLMRLLGAVPIPLEIHKKPRFTSEMRRALAGGCYVVMYPESVLDPYHEGLRRFHDSAFRLAASCGAMILPVTVIFRRPSGLFAILKRRPCVTLNILPPVDVGMDGTVRERADAMQFECRKLMESSVEGENTDDTNNITYML
ncbi:MAG: lysophospholipid acyltransferase family protein [Eubacteriales bacterium]